MGLLSGLLKGAGKVVGGLVKKVAPAVVPGGNLIKTAVSVGASAVKKAVRRNAKKIIAGGAAAVGVGAAAMKRAVRTPGGAAVVGAVGGVTATEMVQQVTGRAPRFGRSYRRINPGNTKAMRRAIRRIEQGARLYSKFFAVKHGRIKGAPGVRVRKLSIRRAA